MENDVKCRIKEYLRANGSNPSKVAAKYSVNQKTLRYAEILEKDVRSDYDMIADKLKKSPTHHEQGT